jgi:hypothetical protein
MTDQHIRIDKYVLGGHREVVVRAGRMKTERIVPPAGEAFAFDREVWPRRVSIAVSPTGRSVRVWVDGVEVKPSHKASSSDHG